MFQSHGGAGLTEVTVTETCGCVGSEPMAGRVMTVLAAELRGSTRCCRHYQTQIPSEALNPHRALSPQQHHPCSHTLVSKPHLGGLDGIEPPCCRQVFSNQPLTFSNAKLLPQNVLACCLK